MGNFSETLFSMPVDPLLSGPRHTYRRERAAVKKAKFLAVIPAAAAALIAFAPAASAASASLTVSPSTGLKDGTSVSFSGTGFVKSTTIYVLECHGTTPSQAACDTARLVPAQSD